MSTTGAASSPGVAQWEHEKQGHAAHLYTLLAVLVGNPAALRHTSAFLSWRTAAGVQGHWREEAGQVWLGRIIWTGEGRQSEQVVLALETVGEGEDLIRLVQPRAHYGRTADGPVVGCDPDTPALYAAAQALLTQLTEELRTMLNVEQKAGSREQEGGQEPPNIRASRSSLPASPHEEAP